MPSHYDSPRYQRQLFKVMALSPGHRKVFDSLIDVPFAQKAMQHRLRLLGMAADKKAAQHRELMADKRYGLQSRMADISDRSARKNEAAMKRAERLGYANIAVSGLSGLGESALKRKEAQELNKLYR